MKETHIDQDRFMEATSHYLLTLADDKPISFDVLDGDGNVIFKAGTTMKSSVIEMLAAKGRKFWVPRVGRDGDYSRQIFSHEIMQQLVEDTDTLFSEIRQNGSMTHEQFINATNQYQFLLQRTRPQDRTGGVLTLIHKAKAGSHSAMHSVNVGLLSMIYALKNGDPADRIQTMAIAGFLHDIGKLRVPEMIIQKPDVLTRGEFAAMMEHSREGYRILDAVVNGAGEKIVPNLVKIVSLFHHRKFKNAGYPFKEDAAGINSERTYLELPREARIIAIIDLYDAITTNTPYRRSMGIESALRYILNLSGYLYAADDTQAFLRTMGLTLNHGKSFLNPGDFVVLESIKPDPDKKKRIRVFEFAKIEEIYRSGILTPKVSIFYNVSRNKKINPISIDLHYDASRKIVRVINSRRLVNMLVGYMA